MADGRLNTVRVIIVGAGPAGARAAECLVRHGLRPIVIDEQPRGGGQIYRRPPVATGFIRTAKNLYGFEAAKAAALHQAFDGILGSIDYRPETLAWDISNGAVWTSHAGAVEPLPYDALILATGAMDRIIPFPGWTTPGVFTLGGAQVALKYQGCAIGRRTVFLGTGPLLYLVAYQYAKAGAEVAAVLDTAPFAAKLRALPGLLAGGRTFAKGLYYIAWLRARGIKIENSVAPVEAIGQDRIIGLVFRDAKGMVRKISCNAVGFGYGLKPETQLADLAGCRFAWNDGARQWLPQIDDEGRAIGCAGVYVAGDGAAIAGADGAELRGEVAALAVLRDLGIATGGSSHSSSQSIKLNKIKRLQENLQMAFPFPAGLAAGLADDVILCRCEGVTVGEVRRSATALDATELNRAKAYSRLGMGRCQGRVCGPAAAETLAAALGVPVEQVGRLRGQPPVKPIGLLDMAALAGDEP